MTRTTNPLPGSSLGDIGVCAEVRWRREAAPFSPQPLELSYADAELGWVDPESLRCFEIVPELGEFRLVERSWLDPEGRRVLALVERPGTYGLFGLPAPVPAREAIRTLREAWPTIRRQRFGDGWEVLPKICEVILCAGDALGGGWGPPPGGGPGGPCELCLGLHPALGGMPEWHLPVEEWHPPLKKFDPHKVPFPKPKPLPRRLLYSLLSDAHLITGSPPVGAAIEIVDPALWLTLDAFPIGMAAAVSLAVAPTGQRLYVLDRSAVRRVVAYTTSGALVWSLQVGYANDIVLSRDEATLYAAGDGGLEVIDTAAGAIVQTIPANGLSGIARSPDGSTLAAVAGFYPAGATTLVSTLYLFDTQPLALTAAVPITDPTATAALPVHPTSVAFADDGRVVLWDDGRDAFYEVDVAAGAQDQAATVGLGVDGAASFNWNNALVVNATSGRAYAPKEHQGAVGTATWAAPGELAELRVGQAAFTTYGSIAPGIPVVPVSDPASDAVYLSVSTVWQDTKPDKLFGYSPGGGLQAAPIFTFATAGIPVRDMHFA